MLKVPAPVHRVRPTLLVCVSLIDDEGFKARAEAAADELEVGESTYREAGRAGALYRIPQTEMVGAVTADEMVSLYDQRLSKKGHPAREIYDTLRAASEFNVCPFCGHRQVATLDHYLPKSLHPLFAITPVNLVPCCSDCNKAKINKVSSDAKSHLFHPYFDDFDDGEWLGAEVLETAPPAVRFFVLAPPNWSEVKLARASTHFSMLGLAELYGSNAAQELAQISRSLTEIGTAAGAEGISAHLLAQARSRSSHRRNSWQAVLYRTLAGSTWFCSLWCKAAT